MFQSHRICLFACIMLVITLLVGSNTKTAAAYAGGSWETQTTVASIENDPQVELESELLVKSSEWIGDTKLTAEFTVRVNRPSDGDWKTHFDIERLYLSTYFPTFDLIVGKQQISWGTGRVWSPSDVFNPPNPFEPDGRREGVTAVVARIPHSPLSFSSLVLAEDKDSGQLSWGARYHGYTSGTDWSLFYANKNENPIFGSDVATDLVGLGVHSELTWEPEYSHNGRLLWLAGADYSWLDGKLVWLGEYLYDSASVATRHSLFNQLSYAYSEFNCIALHVLSNLVDHSRITALSHTAMLNSQWEWTIEASCFHGNADSQYGAMPTDYLVQTGLKYSF